MSTIEHDRQTGDGRHPSDLIPDFLRGTLSPEQERELAAHLEECRQCAEALDVLAIIAEHPAPAMTEEEREGIYERIGFDRLGPARPGSPFGWRSAAWKVAASIALLATGLGVWQIYLAGTSEAGWSAAAALEAWEEDVREIAPSSEDAEVLLAFMEPQGPPIGDGSNGAADLDRVVDGVLDGLDAGVLDGVAVPWEE